MYLVFDLESFRNKEKYNFLNLSITELFSFPRRGEGKLHWFLVRVCSDSNPPLSDKP